MAMPGVASELNHSSDSQACGLTRMPLRSSSWCRSPRQSSSQVPWSVSFRSFNRSLSSFSSGSDAHAYRRGMMLPVIPHPSGPGSSAAGPDGVMGPGVGARKAPESRGSALDRHVEVQNGPGLVGLEPVAIDLEVDAAGRLAAGFREGLGEDVLHGGPHLRVDL